MMYFKQTFIFLTLLWSCCFAVNANIQYQKPLIVLNTVASRPWQNSFVLDSYEEKIDRVSAFTFGVGELMAGGLGCLWAGLALMFFDYGRKNHLFSEFYEIAYMQSLLFLDARLLVGGGCTTYNACASMDCQVAM